MDKTPKPPAPPDPYATAGAQTGANVNSAIASGVIGNANTVSPYGSTSYNQTDTYTMTSPDGQTYQVPRYTQTTTLSPEQQKLYDSNTRVQQGFNDLAEGQTSRLQGILDRPIDLTKLPSITNDFSADRARVEQAMFDRLNPQLERDRAGLENNLTNQGFQRGTEAFSEAMGEYGRNVNDQRLAVTANGLREQEGLFGMATANRARALGEMLTERNQPINEISALFNGGQVTLPQIPGYNAPSVGAADVSGNVYNSAALTNSQWQTQQQAAAQKQAALYGGLGGLGGAAMYGGTGGFTNSMLGGLFKPKTA
jgi:hypothetical protein